MYHCLSVHWGFLFLFSSLSLVLKTMFMVDVNSWKVSGWRIQVTKTVICLLPTPCPRLQFMTIHYALVSILSFGIQVLGLGALHLFDKIYILRFNHIIRSKNLYLENIKLFASVNLSISASIIVFNLAGSEDLYMSLHEALSYNINALNIFCSMLPTHPSHSSHYVHSRP